MSVALWIGVAAAAAGLAYVARFSGATLLLGRTLGGSNVGTGFQDAVTPPWQKKFALLVYGLTLAVLALSWYDFGIGRGIAELGALIVGAIFAGYCLPRHDSDHFKRLIIVSMSRRYANFVRDGDAVRADAMKMLLQKAGISTDIGSGA